MSKWEFDSNIGNGYGSSGYGSGGRRPCNKCNGKYAIGIHQFNDYYWLCNRCHEEYKKHQYAKYIDWTKRETVDSLNEALYYFTYKQKDTSYTSLFKVGEIEGSKGVICNIVEKSVETLDSFQMIWKKKYRYYVLYNRRYLRDGNSLFERASSMHGNWQTVHMKVLDEAARLNSAGELKGHVCIVIVMQDKTTWYIDPTLMKKFTFEYEAERIPYGEQEMEGSIPISKISGNDPFLPSTKV